MLPVLNCLWMDISNILNSPSYDILLDANHSPVPKYLDKLSELTRGVLESSVFGLQPPGKWRSGRRDGGPDVSFPRFR